MLPCTGSLPALVCMCMAKKTGGNTVEFRKFEGGRGGDSVLFMPALFSGHYGVTSITVIRVQAKGQM
jgi:hypothetical protein